MLKSRLITALVLIIGIIWVIFSNNAWSPLVFISVISIFMCLATWEWAHLVPFKSIVSRLIYVAIILLGVGYWAYSTFFLSTISVQAMVIYPNSDVHFNLYFILLCINIIGFIAITAAIMTYPKTLKYWHYRWLIAVLGVFILTTVTIVLLTLKYNIHYGAPYLMTVLLLTWAADTGAYFAGRFWGNKKFLPTVSPNKTWAGFWGGFVLGEVVVIISGYLFAAAPIGWLYWIITGTITLLGAVMGDLFISMLKRCANVKDTGNILPGHGGILDRIDSLLVSSIVMAFFLKLLT